MFHSSKSSLGCQCFCRLTVNMVHENYLMSQFLQKMFRHHSFGNSSRQGKKFCFSRTQACCLLSSWPCCECCVSPLHNSVTCAPPRCCLACLIAVCVQVHPECQFQKSESGFKFGDKRFAAHRQVEGQPSKKTEKGWWQKCSTCIERCTTVGLRISGDRPARIFTDFTEEHKSLTINSTSAIHKSYAPPCKHARKQRSVVRKISSQSSSSAQSIRFEIWG